MWFEEAWNIGRSTQLEPIALDAQHGLAEVMRADDPAATLALLDSIITHPATGQATCVRAAALHDALRASRSRSGSIASVGPVVAGADIAQSGEMLTPREKEAPLADQSSYSSGSNVSATCYLTAFTIFEIAAFQ